MTVDGFAAPPSLAAWTGVELLEPLPGGARNRVFRARRGGDDVVVRVSGRPAEALAWELDLLQTLGDAGLAVPQALTTDDGRRDDGGVLVQRLIPGRPPTGRDDWIRVVQGLRVLHEVTQAWPQRPGFASARGLLHRDRGGDVDLSAMPAAAATLIRTAWAPVLDAAEGAVHGDLGAGNLLLTDDQVGFIDWDEARVDVPAFDYAHVPAEIPVPIDVPRDRLIAAGVAWEAATCWVVEPGYARRRLDELTRLTS